MPVTKPRSVIGLNIERLRKEAGFRTRRQFAEKVGVSAQLVADWELRRTTLDLESLLKVAIGINKSIDDVVAGFSERYDSLDNHQSGTGLSSSVTPDRGKTDRSQKKAGRHVPPEAQARPVVSEQLQTLEFKDSLHRTIHEGIHQLAVRIGEITQSAIDGRESEAASQVGALLRVVGGHPGRRPSPKGRA